MTADSVDPDPATALRRILSERFGEDLEGEAAPFCGVLFDAVAFEERVNWAGGGEEAAAAVVEDDGAHAFKPEVQDEDHYWMDDKK